MARLPRYYLPNQPQHIILRGNNRHPIFQDEEDYLFYLDCLAEASKRNGCQIHAYVLMPNHVHLLVSPTHADSIAKMLQSVGRRYVPYFNQRYQRTGTLWEGRYRATLLESERWLLVCYQYIELNPVRVNLVKTAEEYVWSSYHHHAKGVANGLITDHPLYTDLGENPFERRAEYRALFKTPLAEPYLIAIREATNKAWVLGGDKFKAEVAALTSRRTDPLPRGRPRKKDAVT